MRRRSATHALLIVATLGGALSAQEPKRRDEGAAPLYRTALLEARRALEAEPTGALPIPVDPDRHGDEWRAAVAKTAVACTLFAQAAALPKCRFRPPNAEESDGEYPGIAVPLLGLAQIVAAHGRQQAVDDPSNTIADAAALLGNARHATQQECLFGVAVASQVERLALELLDMVATEAGRKGDLALVRRCLGEVDRQEAATPSIARIADIAAAEARTLLSSVEAEELRGAAEGPVKARALALLDELVAPLRKTPAPPSREIDALYQAAAMRLKKLATESKPETEAELVEAAAAGVASMLMPNMAAFVEHSEVRARQREELRARLRRLLDEAGR